jgi:glycosyltransferase involved in cell wall biosynthesis
VICVCGAVAEVCRESGIPDRLLRIVNNGSKPTPLPRLNQSGCRLQLGLSERDFVILVVSHLNSCKGHEYLLEALPRIVGKNPRTKLLLAGAGPQEQTLKTFVRQLGMDRVVRFLGFRDDVPTLLKAADLLVLPSLAEGLSAVLLEAASAGCPVVTTTVGGAEDLFSPYQVDGPPLAWLVPPADSDALAGAIVEAMEDVPERRARARRARRRVKSKFGVEEMVSKTLEVYHEVMDQKSVVPSEPTV